MELIIVVLCIVIVVLACALLAYMVEVSRIRRQLNEIKTTDIKPKVRSSVGVCDKLILQINDMLSHISEVKADYQAKNRAMNQMMTNISHDLRTPLTSALGYINLIQHTKMSEEEKLRELGVIEKRLLRLEELINSFFELTQIISSGKLPELVDVNLVSVLEEAMVHYYDDYTSRSRGINFKTDSHKISLVSNRNLLMRIFDNLIGNALKHGTGDLNIQVDSKAKSVILTNKLASTDSGIDVNHVFDEFYTTDISRTKGNTGLGLAIAKQFTEMLGGEIKASIEYTSEGEMFKIVVKL